MGQSPVPMNMPICRVLPSLRFLAASASFSCLCVAAVAAPVVDWHTFKATTATTLSGQGTDHPTVGSLTTTADASFVIGYLSTPITLTNPGEQITFTFNVSF